MFINQNYISKLLILQHIWIQESNNNVHLTLQQVENKKPNKIGCLPVYDKKTSLKLKQSSFHQFFALCSISEESGTFGQCISRSTQHLKIFFHQKGLELLDSSLQDVGMKSNKNNFKASTYQRSWLEKLKRLNYFHLKNAQRLGKCLIYSICVA